MVETYCLIGLTQPQHKMRLLFLFSLALLNLITDQKEISHESSNAFAFRLISTPNNIDLQSESGCNWLSLHFSIRQNGNQIFVNETGMLGSNPNIKTTQLETSAFLLGISAKTDTLIITGYKGTMWREYKAACPNGFCAFDVDENAISPSN